MPILEDDYGRTRRVMKRLAEGGEMVRGFFGWEVGDGCILYSLENLGYIKTRYCVLNHSASVQITEAGLNYWADNSSDPRFACWSTKNRGNLRSKRTT
jgi:hypothetical protein